MNIKYISRCKWCGKEGLEYLSSSDTMPMISPSISGFCQSHPSGEEGMPHYSLWEKENEENYENDYMSPVYKVINDGINAYVEKHNEDLLQAIESFMSDVQELVTEYMIDNPCIDENGIEIPVQEMTEIIRTYALNVVESVKKKTKSFSGSISDILFEEYKKHNNSSSAVDAPVNSEASTHQHCVTEDQKRLLAAMNYKITKVTQMNIVGKHAGLYLVLPYSMKPKQFFKKMQPVRKYAKFHIAYNGRFKYLNVYAFLNQQILFVHLNNYDTFTQDYQFCDSIELVNIYDLKP